MTKHPAIKFRRKIYVAGPHHADAIDAAFKSMTEKQVWRAYGRVQDGKEDIVFGFACEDGTEFVPTTFQDGRKRMYGFTD